jgi:hypothetical protein
VTSGEGCFSQENIEYSIQVDMNRKNPLKMQSLGDTHTHTHTHTHMHPDEQGSGFCKYISKLM